MPQSTQNNTDYINSTEYSKLEDKIKQLSGILSDLADKSEASRKLRYNDVDIEAEREAQRIAPDELYIPLHIIDTNIRREQSPYVQFIAESDRAIICKDLDNSTNQLALLEGDLTSRLRFDSWQLSQFANIDNFQANGYGIMEVIQDLQTPGEVAHEMIRFEDFAFISDTRDIQSVEMTDRCYYFTKTKLLSLCGDGTDPQNHWDSKQVTKLIESEPANPQDKSSVSTKDRSLYCVHKIMFKVNGIVHVGWSNSEFCDDWLRIPKPLNLGRKKQAELSKLQTLKLKVGIGQAPEPEDDYETEYPYVLFPYLISENDTIAHLKGRVFLDQDLQEGASSLVSSTVTQARRASGLYFSKETSDPNDDILMQKNIFLRQGVLINANVKQMSLQSPDPSMFSAINMLVAQNQNETSQVNFAVNNRKDSRKTAEEIKTASQQAAVLSTVQVVLYSISLCQLYRKMSSIIKSRVVAGLITVSPEVLAQYKTNFIIRPAGDTDVIKRQQTIQSMMAAWPVVQNTPMAEVFLLDLLRLMFPDRYSAYEQVFNQTKQQQSSAQAQQMQQFMTMAKSMADGIIHLAKRPEMFSETGKIHALPVVETAAEHLEGFLKNLQKQQPQQQ